MPDTVINVNNISKQYFLGEEQSGSLRETLTNMFKIGKRPSHEFWALKDISFNVEQGDVVGIVGKNGAGKSTLLKIMSRITQPTIGSITYRGRIASLLEVGTGFHGELTGRENIYLNGTILGMNRKEIKYKFDEIVDFSGIEEFLDTPVKHYSSGMYVRLAFAVAAHLEPEILIIDEVLAVGDAEFQKKCLGKMKDVSSKEGRTVIFVSHNMTAVNTLCTKGIFLEMGALKYIGSVEDTTRLYLTGDNGVYRNSAFFSGELGGDGDARVISVKVLNSKNKTSDYYKIDEDIHLEMIFEVLSDKCNPMPNYHVYSSSGEKVFSMVDTDINADRKPGKYRSICTIPAHFFNEGIFVLGVSLSTLSPVTVHFQDHSLLSLEIVDNLSAITRNKYTGSFSGALRPLFPWKIENITA